VPKTDHLTPWEPGQSGNPAGRPVNPIKQLAREAAPEAFAKILALTRSPDEKLAMQACVEIVNRAWGKPAQAIIGGDEDDAPVAIAIRRFFKP
jgi:hypothetical protein